MFLNTMTSRVARRFLLAARPLPISKSSIRHYVDQAYKEIQSVLKQYKPHPRFQDMELRSTPSSSTLEKQTRVVSTIEVYPVGRKPSPGQDLSIKIPLEINFKNTSKSWMVRQYIAGGRVLSRGFAQSERMSPFKMEISVNLSESYKDLTSPQNAQKIKAEMFSVLIHEFTHAEDWISPQQAVKPYDDPETYYNLPHERRAFMQQISDEIITAAQLHPPELAFENLRQYFRKKLDESTTWNRIREYLTNPSQKAILSGVWTGFQDAIRAGEIFIPLILRGWVHPSKIIDLVVQANQQGKIDKTTDYGSITGNAKKLKEHMVEAAKEGVLWDRMSFGDYGFIYKGHWQMGSRLEKQFIQWGGV